jgi:transcriptional regulator with XRE-family HTH domain
MVMPVFAFGKVKPLRQAKGLNQAEMAAELGMSRPTFVLLEQGQKEPTLSQLYTLSRLLGVEVGELCSNLPAGFAEGNNYDKFKELVAACVLHGADGGNLTKTKLSILTYLADFAWFKLHSLPLTGALYRASNRGPVADHFFRAVDELYEAQAIAIETRGTAMIIRAVEQQPTTRLSEKEISLIHDICTKWRHKSTESILAFSFNHKPNQNAGLGQVLLYESILGTPKELLY